MKKSIPLFILTIWSLLGYAHLSAQERELRYRLTLRVPNNPYKLAFDPGQLRYLVLQKDSFYCLPHDSLRWSKLAYSRNELDPDLAFKDLQVVMSGNRILLVLQSGGEVYELHDNAIVRLDHSSNFRTQHGSFKFMMGDTLMSYGGYGFWKMEPFFTRFDFKTGEWEMWELNDDQPLPAGRAYFMAYYHPPTHDLYILGGYDTKYKARRPIEHEIQNDVWKINMVERKWRKLGTFSDWIEAHHYQSSVYKNQVLAAGFKERYLELYDFPGNKVRSYQLEAEKLECFNNLIQPALNETDQEILFGTISNSIFNSPDIRILPLSGLLNGVPTERVIYHTTWRTIGVTGIAILVILLSVLFVRRFKQSVRRPDRVEFDLQSGNLKYKNIQIYLDDIEQKVMIELARSSEFRNVVDLFGTLLDNKSSMDTLYKNKKKTFRSINDKVNFVTKGKSDLFLTRKNPSDNRMIEIKINEAIVQIL